MPVVIDTLSNSDDNKPGERNIVEVKESEVITSVSAVTEIIHATEREETSESKATEDSNNQLKKTEAEVKRPHSARIAHRRKSSTSKYSPHKSISNFMGRVFIILKLNVPAFKLMIMTSSAFCEIKVKSESMLLMENV